MTQRSDNPADPFKKALALLLLTVLLSVFGSMQIQSQSLPELETLGIQPIKAEVGRPTDVSSLDLAWCAGLLDGLLSLEGMRTLEDGVTGDVFMNAALVQHERRPQSSLEEVRRLSRAAAMHDFADPAQRHGSAPIHAMMPCYNTARPQYLDPVAP